MIFVISFLSLLYNAYILLFLFYVVQLRKAGPYRARRGAGTSIVGPYFFKKQVFPPPTAQFRPRERHAAIRLATAISVHTFSSKKAFCSPGSSNISAFQQTSAFSIVYNKVTAMGVSRRDPPRHGVFGAQNLVKKHIM